MVDEGFGEVRTVRVYGEIRYQTHVSARDVHWFRMSFFPSISSLLG
jgi:hypothetical protein